MRVADLREWGRAACQSTAEGSNRSSVVVATGCVVSDLILVQRLLL